MTTESKARLKQKVDATLDSRNFFVSLISLVFLTLAKMNGAEVPEGASSDLLDAINAEDLTMIITVIVPNFINPLLKIIKERKWNKAIFKSKNFITQAVTVLILGLAGFGIAFPEQAAAEIVDSVFGGEANLIILAITANVINPLYHFFFDKEKETQVEVAIEKK